MTDPNTPPQPTNNPQDLIDQALGGTATPVVTPDPSPTLPVPEALTPPAAVTEEAPMSTESVLPPTETVPTELTAKPEVSPAMSEPPVDTKPMGEDMPLAFAGMPTDVAADTSMSNVTASVIEPVNNVVPPILTNPAPTMPVNKGKGAMSKVKMVVVAVLAFLGITGGVGLYAYQRYGTIEPATIAVIGDKTKDECSGCVNGGWLVWRNGQCKHTGICGNDKPDKNTAPPDAPPGVDPADNCRAVGGEWCANVVDASGQSHAFCGSKGKACYQSASEKGITVIIGSVKCKESNGTWVPDGSYTDVGISDEVPNPNNGQPGDTYGPTLSIYEQVDRQCKAQSGSFTALGNTEMWICPVGTTVACTANVQGAKRFYGNPANGFCGVIQVDTGTGHTSYSSTESCDEPEETPNPTPTPSAPVVSTLMCTGLTRTPTTTPTVGDKVTFTCVGASTPAGAVSLTYKFRYSLNSGAYVAMTNKTATTSELTIASCGSYKVQCQACGTINGVLTCDPNWTAATQ